MSSRSARVARHVPTNDLRLVEDAVQLVGRAVAPRLRFRPGISSAEATTRRGRQEEPDEEPFHEPVVEQREPAPGVGRGIVTAEMRRQQSTAAKEAMRAVRIRLP
jgi:hypothetical protein